MAKNAAVDFLESEHKTLKALFQEYKNKEDGAGKQSTAERIFRELETHGRVEEEIFYPPVKERTTEDGRESVLEGIEEHHVIDVLIAELRALDPSDERYDAKMKVLRENAEHHIDEEEDELFVESNELSSEELARLAERMKARKSELLRTRTT